MVAVANGMVVALKAEEDGKQDASQHDSYRSIGAEQPAPTLDCSWSPVALRGGPRSASLSAPALEPQLRGDPWEGCGHLAEEDLGDWLLEFARRNMREIQDVQHIRAGCQQSPEWCPTTRDCHPSPPSGLAKPTCHGSDVCMVGRQPCALGFGAGPPLRTECDPRTLESMSTASSLGASSCLRQQSQLPPDSDAVAGPSMLDWLQDVSGVSTLVSLAGWFYEEEEEEEEPAKGARTYPPQWADRRLPQWADDG